MMSKKWSGNPKRYQTKAWRKLFGINPKTGSQFKPFMVATKNNKRPKSGIQVKFWRGRK